MIWLLLILLLLLPLCFSAEDRDRAKRWQELMDDIQRKNKPLD